MDYRELARVRVGDLVRVDLVLCTPVSIERSTVNAIYLGRHRADRPDLWRPQWSTVFLTPSGVSMVDDATVDHIRVIKGI